MFKKFFGSDKIKVQLIEALSNEEFGLIKLLPDQLPASFDKPTTMHIEGEDWIVEKAQPASSEEFIKKGELVLWLKKVLKVNPAKIRFSIPTITNELPGTSDVLLYHDFTHTIHEDDWRQMEFLPQSLLSEVQTEMKFVEEILFPENDPDFDSLNGFYRIHVRKIGRQQLTFSVNEFLNIVDVMQKGNLAINGHLGFVENGFAFRSSNHIYYGTVKNGTISELCLDEFEGIDEEINNLLIRLNLLLVCWCRGTISSG